MKLQTIAFGLLISIMGLALPEAKPPFQVDYESLISGMVRNKIFYKAGSIELSVVGGLMPYDLLVDHLNIGGRLTWHLGDHWGWEVIDFQALTSRTTSFTNDLIADSNKNIQRLDVVKAKNIAMTGILVSPLYGKVRFLGSSVLYFDIYGGLGVGVANVETVKLQFGQAEALLGTSWDPCFSLSLGAKLFFNSAMGLVVDLRDYVINSQSYDKRSLKSNYTVMLGLSFFLPPL